MAFRPLAEAPLFQPEIELETVAAPPTSLSVGMFSYTYDTVEQTRKRGHTPAITFALIVLRLEFTESC